ncbi:MAG: hypothetical protein JXA42_13600 [Anaerolineales bacterium]|nr:hypothetical protein [Anaerolineales bacterium]
MRLIWTTIRRRLFLILVFIGLVLSLTWERPDPTNEDFVYDSLVRDYQFDFVEWEIKALASKAVYSLAPPHIYLQLENEKSIVLSYFDLLSQARSLESEIAAIYTNPDVTSPESATIDLRNQSSTIRERLARLQPVAEGIIQDQIGIVLAESGLTAAGRTFPPVEIHFTPLPSMLVVSRRDRIEAIRFFSLENGLGTAERTRIEEEIDHGLDVSSLVVDIGGLAAYPAMMLESTSLNWVIETGAHEWTHHYLTLHPLGILYDTDPQLRTMNETTASIVGSEIGKIIVRRFYPEFYVPEQEKIPQTDAEPQELPAFDYRAEMHLTRIQVDELLAQDKIKNAEAYMEERRLFFYQNGYQIRKINQAYFAFYGAYADETGASGADPVGPSVIQLRNQSDSLKTFLEAMAGLTGYDQLLSLLGNPE